jgi:ankyrin repeat protein
MEAVLLGAAWNGHTDITKLLLENGTNADYWFGGRYPLYLAIKQKHQAVINTLFSHGGI